MNESLEQHHHQRNPGHGGDRPDDFDHRHSPVANEWEPTDQDTADDPRGDADNIAAQEDLERMKALSKR